MPAPLFAVNNVNRGMADIIASGIGPLRVLYALQLIIERGARPEDAALSAMDTVGYGSGKYKSTDHYALEQALDIRNKFGEKLGFMLQDHAAIQILQDLVRNRHPFRPVSRLLERQVGEQIYRRVLGLSLSLSLSHSYFLIHDLHSFTDLIVTIIQSSG